MGVKNRRERGRREGRQRETLGLYLLSEGEGEYCTAVAEDWSMEPTLAASHLNLICLLLFI